MDPTGFVFAFSAGAVTFLSPCNLPLLPAYITYYLGLRDSTRENVTAMDMILKRGLPRGLMVAMGVIFVFSFIGLLTGAIGQLITPYIVLMPLIVGVILVVMGILMLLRLNLTFYPSFKPSQKRDWSALFSFGLLYGLGSAGCSAPIFISILAYSISLGDITYGALILFSYALGLSGPLIGVTLLVVGAKEAALKKLFNIFPISRKIAGVILISVGVYLLYYYLLSTLYFYFD
ncbi:MAG: hypothetical protein GTN80_05670 [Nitrososphaeria archaeon]|nr:hypothetical protein [Nitrososphaeria archaeon]NIN52637.1 hypothetical protein [Nitrososphaeria archaeon]NIQ33112.1 hypothetical protein [Nitrososphaeria archaeon]